ncbi:MAG TPA: HWE histidine kinase domain-containing protein [Pseudolabrys sp.]|nr:HWE histidine kinase domain-containing protein [Pseudolabrys sp.]
MSLLKARFAHYETALRGSHVTVYTQDRDLCYTSISNPMFGRAIDDIVGHTDEQIFPLETCAAFIPLKRTVLATGEAQSGEIKVLFDGTVRWHDLHIEPLRSERDEIVGLTCASVDITERKEAEAHLRLLMRELTHRSKNLLAVIQAMARRTARHVGSIDAFLDQFGARLQALASSHDLLVRESWHGASLIELIRSQLGGYVDRDEVQVSIDGPPVLLKPEAAQNLGLAMHELATNAAKYGALSVPEGRVSIQWHRRNDGDGHALDLTWTEQSGPRVKARRKRGFGSLVIEGNLARALDAQVDWTFEPEGARCHIVVPSSQILAQR